MSMMRAMLKKLGDLIKNHFSYTLLVIYCASYFQGRYYVPTGIHVSGSLQLILVMIVTLSFGILAALILVGVGTSVVINALSQVQAH